MDDRERWQRILDDRQDDRLTEYVLRARERYQWDRHPADRPVITDYGRALVDHLMVRRPECRRCPDGLLPRHPEHVW